MVKCGSSTLPTPFLHRLFPVTGSPCASYGEHVQQSKTDTGISFGASASTPPPPHFPPTGSPCVNRGAAWLAVSTRHWRRSWSTDHSCWPTSRWLAPKRARHCWTLCSSAGLVRGEPPSPPPPLPLTFWALCLNAGCAFITCMGFS